MKKTIFSTLETKIEGEIHYSKHFKEFYSLDASSYQIIPKIIVIPKNDKDVINTIKIAKKFKVGVTPRGGGTGLVGSALNDGIILDMKNFNSCKIRKTHVNVGTGITKGFLDKKLKKHGKFFPPNPSIGMFCTIGGMLGNNSSGSRSLKYGSMIDNVSEITFVDGRAKKITLPGDENQHVKKILKIAKKIDKSKIPKVTKNSSGYRLDKVGKLSDIYKTIIGSEGTLGIILSVKLQIKDIPKQRILFITGYNSERNASKECLSIIKTKPTALEYVDRNTIKKVNLELGEKFKSFLFVEYDSEIQSKKSKFKDAIKKGAIIKEIKKEKEISQWWRYRDSSLHYSLKSIKKEQQIPHVIEDAAVPLEKLPALFETVNKINRRYNTRSIAYGHAGNGNIHVRLIADRKNTKMIKKIAMEYFDEIIKMRGTITAEHGDGLARSEFIKKQYGVKNYRLFTEVKKIFDPYNILNPDKIITDHSTVIKNM